VLKRIFLLKWYEVTGAWRRLHNEEFYVLYFSPNTIRVIKSITSSHSMSGKCSTYEYERKERDVQSFGGET
jgi:hypothetical protein